MEAEDDIKTEPDKDDIWAGSKDDIWAGSKDDQASSKEEQAALPEVEDNEAVR